MSRKYGTWAVVGVIVAVAGTVVGLRLQADRAERRPTVLVWAANQPLPDNFFPLISAGNTVSTAQLEVQVLPGPFRLRPDQTVVPDEDLLTSEPTSALVRGRQVLTYRLDPRARWSDGPPIDAADFEFSWRIQRSREPARGGCTALISTTGYDQIDSVRGADGGRTVVVTLSRPYADWKSLFNQGVFPAHLMDSADPAAVCATMTRGWPAAGGIPVSGGPWQVEDVNTLTKTVSLTPNPSYWGHKPKLDRLIWQSFDKSTDSASVVNALRAGEVDLANPPPRYDLVDRLRALAPAVVTEIKPGLTFDHLDLNVQNVHLGQKTVRQAIASALDRPALVRATVGQMDPEARVLNNRMYLTSQPEYAATNGGRYEHADIAAARHLLEGAGYTAGADGVYARGGKRLSLKLITTEGDEIRRNATEVIAAQLRRAGFEIHFRPSLTIFGDKDKRNSLESGDFDMALYSWVSTPFVTFNQTIYASPHGSSVLQNYSRGVNRRVDELFGLLAVELRPAGVVTIANRIDTLLWEDLFTIPLYQRPVIEAHDRDFLNIALNPAAVGIGWNANDWTTT